MNNRTQGFAREFAAIFYGASYSHGYNFMTEIEQYLAEAPFDEWKDLTPFELNLYVQKKLHEQKIEELEFKIALQKFVKRVILSHERDFDETVFKEHKQGLCVTVSGGNERQLYNAFYEVFKRPDACQMTDDEAYVAVMEEYNKNA